MSSIASFGIMKVEFWGRKRENFENLENEDFGGVGHSQGFFWPKLDVGGCAAHNVLKNTWLAETV